MNRGSGILMPVASLPSRFGIGGFGKESYHFVDLLEKGGYRLWQILPLNPLGYGHSPYQPFSSFAIDDLYTDLDDLKRRGFLKEAPSYPGDTSKIHYEEVREWMKPYLEEAYQNAKEKEKSNITAFMATYAWAKAWGLFMFYKRKNALRSWNEWPKEEEDRINHLDALTDEEVEGVFYEVWLQMNLYREWKALRAYANRKGIRLIGDVPFYVGYDSCDVWSNLDTFEIDPITKEPIWIAGVPPDYFCATGQRWGNPIYKWDLLKKNRFSFIINRLKGNAELYDVIRLDHFRAFDTYWRIPASCPTAVDGEWIEAPGYAFFDTFFKEVKNVEIIAEDLGNLRPQVLTLRDHYHLPGMNVVEFTFRDAEIDHKLNVSNPNMVVYLGTHDNEPFKGFFDRQNDWEKNIWKETLRQKGFTNDDPCEAIREYALSLPANYTILAMQDILEFGNEARLNEPSTINDFNWTWHLRDYEKFISLLPSLKALNEKYHR